MAATNAAALVAGPSFGEIVIQNRRTETARSLYNDAVRDTIGLRQQRLLRLLRLAAHLPAPSYFDIDTTLNVPAPVIHESPVSLAAPRPA